MPVLPIQVSPNRRYFVDQENQPVFWLGDTQWELFRAFSQEDARTILENRRDKGFAFIQVTLLGVGDGLRPNVYGQTPWKDVAKLTPNEEYFRHVDATVEMARALGLVLVITVFHQRHRGHITLEKARPWARWLSHRYRDLPNIQWTMTPEATEDFVPIVRELAAGLQEGDGGTHPLTFKPDPAPTSSSFLHHEPWLAYNAMQVWKWVNLISPMVQLDYALEPIRPVVMAEGAYEAGTEYGLEVSPLWVRRQAYYSYLLGAHHTYGHNDSWRVLPTWKSALDAPGAGQLSLLRQIFLQRSEWWRLEPDQTALAAGGRTSGELLNLAARHRDGRWLLAYLANPGSVTVRLDKLGGCGTVRAQWIDPRSGVSTALPQPSHGGTQTFATPAGFEDALLVLERAG